MANGRNGGRRRDAGRESGGFVALPLAVLQSTAYLRLSHPARSLLLEVAMQFHGDDNGRMLLSTRHLTARGWKSHDVAQRAKKELLDSQLIVETVKGQRPSKAAWYAVTWRTLDTHLGFDAGVASAFKRGAYQNASLNPSGGIVRAPTIPSNGITTPPPIPPDGTVEGVFGDPPIPPDGNPLDLAICGAGVPAAGQAVQPALALATPRLLTVVGRRR